MYKIIYYTYNMIYSYIILRAYIRYISIHIDHVFPIQYGSSPVAGPVGHTAPAATTWSHPC